METALKVKATIELTLNQISDLLVTAFEGGSNYWLDDYKFSDEKKPDVEFLQKNISGMYVDCKHAYWPLGGEMTVFADEDEKAYFLNMDSIQKGLQLMAEKQPEHFGNILTENFDAITADVFLQFCLFDEIVYG